MTAVSIAWQYRWVPDIEEAVLIGWRRIRLQTPNFR